MKKALSFTLPMFLMASMFTSCYVNTFNVGKGAQGSTTVKQWNHYLIDGLIPIDVSDAQKLAAGATDYTVTIKHSFVNGLLQGLTGGIYCPTTTVVTK